jgi:hypothetical protein
MHRVSIRLLGYFLLFCMLVLSVAQAEIDGQQVLEGLNVSPKGVARLEDGGILTFSDEAYESTKRELSADAMILVDTDLDAVMRSITEEATLVPMHKVIAHAVIHSEADFAAVGFTDKEYGEVKKLLSAKPGKDLNFSSGEYDLLRQMLSPHLHSEPAIQSAAASDAMRQILIGR